MRITYVEKKFRGEALSIIDQANRICATYQAQGFDLTLRQLYYQFVSRALIANKDSEYKRLGGIINDARLAGLIDWDYIVDRTRNVEINSHWDTPAQIIRGAARSYAIDKWQNQPSRVEVWIEKDALKGVLEQVCPQLDVPYFSCRGYTSQSEIWGAAQRLNEYLWAGQDVTVLHLGDHDPSGIDMSRDIEDRLRLFTSKDGVRKLSGILRDRVKSDEEIPEKGTPEWEALVKELNAVEDGWGQLTIKRIALTMDQVYQYNPPPNPAKVTDARFTGYQQIYGDESWELDALDPLTLTALIEDEVGEARDDEVWDEMVVREEEEREVLTSISQRFGEVKHFLEVS